MKAKLGDLLTKSFAASMVAPWMASCRSYVGAFIAWLKIVFQRWTIKFYHFRENGWQHLLAAEILAEIPGDWGMYKQVFRPPAWSEVGWTLLLRGGRQARRVAVGVA